MVFAILGLFIIAGCLGQILSRNTFSGGWTKRKIHSCGWFDDYGFNTAANYGLICPHCGVKDKEWKSKIGRPIPYLPFGWEWKSETVEKDKEDENIKGI